MIGFNISYEGAIFFIVLMMIFFAKSSSNVVQTSLEEPNKPSTSLPDSSNLFPDTSKLKYEPSNPRIHPLFTLQQNSEKCEPIKAKFISRELIDILSPEIFSQVDAFRYLVDKTSKIRVLRLTVLRVQVNNLLKDEHLPRCYIPYVEALSSFLRCWFDIDSATRFIRGIEAFFSPNYADFSFLPDDISSSMSPELLELFAADMFADPTPPLCIFYKLFSTPKNRILNLKAQLQNFIEAVRKLGNSIPFRTWYYIWYADAVWKFLQNESALDDLQRDAAAIQNMAISDQRLLSETSNL